METGINMRGFRLTNPYVGKYCYSITRPPSGGEYCELPENVALCFQRQEKGDVKLPKGTKYGCPLHCVFTDEEGNIVDKSYRYA